MSWLFEIKITTIIRCHSQNNAFLTLHISATRNIIRITTKTSFNNNDIWLLSTGASDNIISNTINSFKSRITGYGTASEETDLLTTTAAFGHLLLDGHYLTFNPFKGSHNQCGQKINWMTGKENRSALHSKI